MAAPVLSRQRQVEEIIKCGKEPAYFFRTYTKIQHPIRGTIPFKTYAFQDQCVEDFINHRFNIVLKSRQLGLSTLVAAYAVWLALFHKDQNILIIATKMKVAQNIIKKVKTIIANLPRWLFITEMTLNNRQEVEFKNGSSIKAIPTSEDAGRSEALSLLIIDEAAFVRNFDELWTGLYPTLSTGGRAIILSTPNGVGNKYHEIYSQAEAGINEFNPIKLPWDVHPERDQAWFDKETRGMPPRDVAQELLCDFLASGDTFLSDEDIRWIGTLVQPPVEKSGPDNNLWIWKYPLAGRRYMIPADVSRGDAADFSTFQVIDVSGDIVAEYKGKLRPDKFAELLFDIGMRYNKALICPENNNYGYAVCMKLVEDRYPRLYYQGSKGAYLGDYIPPQELSKAGFNTQGHSRIRILAKLEELIRNKILKNPSARFYDELKTFVWNSDKAQAMRGKNDDLVLSMAIGAWLLDASEGYSQSADTISRVMLEAMGTSSRQYVEPEIRGSTLAPKNGLVSVTPSINDFIGANSRVRREVGMMQNLDWLLDRKKK